jgi:hypothetical protein
VSLWYRSTPVSPSFKSCSIASEQVGCLLVKFRNKMSLEMVLLALIERKDIDLRKHPNPQFYLNNIFPDEPSGYYNFCKESLPFGKELQSFGRKDLILHVITDRRARIFAGCLSKPTAFGNLWKPDDARVFILKGKFSSVYHP